VKRILVGLVLGALAACAHTQQPPAEARQPTSAPAAQPPAPPPAPAASTPAAATAESTTPASVYFRFDSADIARSDAETLATLGVLLAKHPEMKVKIEGNCDERGSEQYNLALGQRRAEASRKYLEKMGAKPAQLEAISYGSSRPRAQGHDEESWKQNRRDDLVPNSLPLR